MAKEILLYSSIHSFTAEIFIEKIEAAKGNDIVLRIDTVGGDPQAAFGMIAKFAEHEGNKLVKVDGRANSSGAFFLAYADNVEVLDASEIIIHRAAFPEWMEAREGFKDSDEFKRLAKINTFLRSGLEAKIDVEQFEKVTKVTLDEIFSTDSRIDVSLTPAQAKKIGLVDKINKLTSEMKAEIHTNAVAMAASLGVDVAELKEVKTEAEIKAEVEEVKKQENKNKNKNKMTIKKLEAENPEVFAEAVKLGVSQEKNRIEAILVFSEIDMKACIEKIGTGENLDQKFQAEMTVKGIKASTVAKTEEEGAEGVDQKAEEEKTVSAEAKKLADFSADVDNNLKAN